MQSQDKKLTCPECKNEFDVDPAWNVEDTIECPYCGIEFEVKEKNEAGEITVEIAEEEK